MDAGDSSGRTNGTSWGCSRSYATIRSYNSNKDTIKFINGHRKSHCIEASAIIPLADVDLLSYGNAFVPSWNGIDIAENHDLPDTRQRTIRDAIRWFAFGLGNKSDRCGLAASVRKQFFVLEAVKNGCIPRSCEIRIVESFRWDRYSVCSPCSRCWCCCCCCCSSPLRSGLSHATRKKESPRDR